MPVWASVELAVTSKLPPAPAAERNQIVEPVPG